MEVLITPADAANRVRAALAFANIEVKHAHERVRHEKLTAATMTRLVSPTNPRGASIDELWAVADACCVPRKFMEVGFDLLAEAELAERLEALASDVAALQLRVEELGGEVGSP